MKKSLLTMVGPSICLYLFLYLPIAAVVAGSFNENAHGLAWHSFSLKWYQTLWQNETAAAALKNTLSLALISTAIATTLGSMLGYGMGKHSFIGKRILSRLLYLPFCLPDIILGVALMIFFYVVRQATGWFEPGLPTMVISHVTFQIPFVAMVVRARSSGLDPTLDAAAYDLGASRWQRFRHVTLPLLAPGILAGALLAFTLSLDDFVVSFFTSGAGSITVPILIYSSVKRGITPEINALSSLMILAAILATVAITLLPSKDKMEKNRDAR